MKEALNKKPAELIQGENVKVRRLADRRVRLYFKHKEDPMLSD